jgi:hypothetical protein
VKQSRRFAAVRPACAHHPMSDHLAGGGAHDLGVSARGRRRGVARRGRRQRRAGPDHAPRRDHDLRRDARLRDGLLAAGEAESPTVPVFSTHDEGRTWRRVSLPAGVRRFTSAYLAAGIIVVAPGDRALVTMDDGQTWRSFPLPKDSDACDVARPSEAAIWVVCTNLLKRRRQTVLLTSRDGGQTWARRTTTMTLDANIAAISGDEAWAARGVAR